MERVGLRINGLQRLDIHDEGATDIGDVIEDSMRTVFEDTREKEPH